MTVPRSSQSSGQRIDVSPARDAYVAAGNITNITVYGAAASPASLSRRRGSLRIVSDGLVKPDVFCGRQKELAKIARLAPRRALLFWRSRSAVRVVVLDGLAGAGKTTLMQEFAHRYRRRFRHGLVWVDLKGSHDRPLAEAELLHELLGRLGVDPTRLTPDKLLTAYRREIAQRRLLILLDDAADSGQIRNVVRFDGTSLVLVTSRTELPGLGASDTVEVRSLEQAHALDLLRREVGATRVDAEPKAAASIVQRCGYLPLAIHLVGGRLSGASRSGVALGELDTELASAGLTAIASRDSGRPDVSAQRIRDVFRGIYQRLGPDLQRLFRLIGAGGVRRIDGEIASALTGIPVKQATEQLRDLHAYHLIEPRTNDKGSYQLHDLLWAYATELAKASTDEAHQAALRLLAWYHNTVVAAVQQMQRGQDPVVFEWFNRERLALAAAVKRASKMQAHDICWMMVAQLAELYECWEYPRDWERICRLGFAAADVVGDDIGRATMLAAIGALHVERQQWDQAFASLEHAHGWARWANDPQCLARVLALQGRVLAATGRTADALDACRSSATLSRDVGNLTWQGRALRTLGEAHAADKDWTAAIERLHEALAVHETAAQPTERSRTLSSLGLVLAEVGRFDDAAACLTESIDIDRRTGNRLHEAHALEALAEIYQHQPGQIDAALDLLDRCLTIRSTRWSGSFLPVRSPRTWEFWLARPPGTANPLLAMAECYLALGQRSEALLCWREARTGRPEWAPTRPAASEARPEVDRGPLLASRLLLVHGELEIAAGQVTTAAGAFARAAEVAASHPGRDPARIHFRALMRLGDTYARLEDYDTAERCYAAAQDTAPSIPDTATAGEQRVLAQAADAGATRARSVFRRRIPLRRLVWSILGVAVVLLATPPPPSGHDVGGVRVDPGSGIAALAACVLGIVVAYRLQPGKAGLLTGYLANVPVAIGLLLLTSGQLRERGQVWMLVGYVLFAVVGAAMAWRTLRHRPFPWRGLPGFPLIIASVVGLALLPIVTHAWTGPVQPAVWDVVGVGLVVAGLGWGPLATLTHPAVRWQRQRWALLVGPIAGIIIAGALAAGLGRQTVLLWTGDSGPDWRLAALGLSTAVACGFAGLIGPGRLSAGVLAGQAAFWAWHGFLLGSAHAQPTPPRITAPPSKQWEWLTTAPTLVWLLPLVIFLAVAVLGIATGIIRTRAPRTAHGVRLRPGKGEIVDGAEAAGDPALPALAHHWASIRLRLNLARGLVLLAAVLLVDVVDDMRLPRSHPNPWVPVLLLVIAAYVHPDSLLEPGAWRRIVLQVRPDPQVPAVPDSARQRRLRWLGAAVLAGAAAYIGVISLDALVGSRSWSAPVSNLAGALALASLSVVVAPFHKIAVGGARMPRVAITRWITRGVWIFLVTAAAVPIFTATGNLGQPMQVVVGGVVGATVGITAYAIVMHRQRRAERAWAASHTPESDEGSGSSAE